MHHAASLRMTMNKRKETGRGRVGEQGHVRSRQMRSKRQLLCADVGDKEEKEGDVAKEQDVQRAGGG